MQLLKDGVQKVVILLFICFVKKKVMSFISLMVFGLGFLFGHIHSSLFPFWYTPMGFISQHVVWVGF